MQNYVLSDVVTKVVYFSVVATAFVFVAILLMTGIHSKPHRRTLHASDPS